MKKLFSALLATALLAALVVPGLTHAEDKSAETSQPAAEEEDAPGFDEIEIKTYDVKDPEGNDTMHVGLIYFQPVDMEPAGNSLAKADSDAHMEADISALKGNKLGYSDGVFIPYLQVKLYITSKKTGETQEVAFMPMNASDGPHYGANVKFKDGVGNYELQLEIGAPGNEYLLHVDKETGVTGRFWTEPLKLEKTDFEWTGHEW